MNESALSCPGCAAPMRKQVFERKLGGELPIDICTACKLIWFDRFENMQLASRSLLELFELIHAHQNESVNPLPARMACPRCSDPLVLTHDMQRSTRFVYYRCERQHGKLSAFYQFLREKNFVRNLSPIEVARLKVEVRQVRCSGCGAPINLDTDSACPFCRAPIAVLDADAMQVALSGLLADERQQRSASEGLATVDGMIAALALENSERRDRLSGTNLRLGLESVPDLLELGIGVIARAFRT